jgi:hypothetical protein
MAKRTLPASLPVPIPVTARQGSFPTPARSEEREALAALVATGMAPWAGAAPETTREPEMGAFLDAIFATGAGIDEALRLATHAYGHDAAFRAAALPHLLQALHQGHRWLRNGPLADILAAVGAVDPELAQLGLDAWAKGRTVVGDLDLSGVPVTRWPKGLKVVGDGGEDPVLNLKDTRIARLPDGFHSAGCLWLDRTSLVSLPHGLWVGGSLSLQNCPEWDGLIPDGTYVRYWVQTDRHPASGIPLEDWRALHPKGERVQG